MWRKKEKLWWIRNVRERGCSASQHIRDTHFEQWSQCATIHSGWNSAALWSSQLVKYGLIQKAVCELLCATTHVLTRARVRVHIARESVKSFEDRPRDWMGCGVQGQVTRGWKGRRMVVMWGEKHDGGPATATRKNGLTHLNKACPHTHAHRRVRGLQVKPDLLRYFFLTFSVSTANPTFFTSSLTCKYCCDRTTQWHLEHMPKSLHHKKKEKTTQAEKWDALIYHKCHE